MAAPTRCQPRGRGSNRTGPFSAVAELLGKHRERSPVPASHDFWARFVSPTPCIPAVGAHLLEPSHPRVSRCPPVLLPCGSGAARPQGWRRCPLAAAG